MKFTYFLLNDRQSKTIQNGLHSPQVIIIYIISLAFNYHSKIHCDFNMCIFRPDSNLQL